MLHLISDFYVINTGLPAARLASDRNIEASDAANPQTSSEAASPPSPLSTLRQRLRSTRSLVINEPDPSVVYAHINIEPTLVTITRPLTVNVPSQDEGQRIRQ